MKKTIQTIVLAALCLFLSSAARAQTAALKIGDQVPDITINNIINYKSSSAKLSDFKGKLLILDFWSTDCHASIELLAELARLQQAFPDKLKIITVGKGEKDEVKRITSPKGLSALSLIASDSLLNSLFPHYLFPQLVWINPELKVLGITTAYDANEATIQKILDGEQVVFKDPKADRMDYNPDKPLFSNSDGGESQDLYHSVLKAYTNGLPGELGIRKDSSRIRIYAANQGRLSLYFMALNLPMYSWPLNRIIYQNVASDKFRISNRAEEKQEKAYCYELDLPLFFEDRARAIMLQDLQRLFGTGARIEKRNTLCYVLSTTPGKLKLQSSGSETENNFQSAITVGKFMNNSPLFSLLDYLEQIPGSLPVIDETGFTGRIDLQLNNNLQDIPALNYALLKYGLQLQRAERAIDMLVLYSMDSAPAASLIKP